MKWSHLVQTLKGMDPPYNGTEDDFDGVVSYLERNGHDADAVDGADGEPIALKDLFDSRPGQRLNLSAAAEKAAMEEEITARVMEQVDVHRGIKRKAHVKVGKDRRSDDLTGGFKSAGHFFRDVIKAGNRAGPTFSDELETWTKTAPDRYGATAPDADGGYAVPPNFLNEILQEITGEESMLARTDRYTISQGNSMDFPYDETDATGPGGASGGISANWTAEAAPIQQDKPILSTRNLKLHKLVTLVPLTDELIDDAPAINSYVPRKAAQAMDWEITEAMFNGTGTGEPTGFLVGGALLNLARQVTTANGGNIVYDDIIKMWTRMYAPWRSNAVWLVGQDVEQDLIKLSRPGINTDGTDATGFGVAGTYLPAGITGGSGPTLLGRPVIVTHHASALNTLGDISLVNWSQYATLTKSAGVQSFTSMHVWFDYDVTALKFRFRMDGRPWPSAPYTAPNGIDYGAFIALDPGV